MPVNIRIAKSAGFCFGVQRALSKVLNVQDGSKTPVRTLGPLIHNKNVLEVLAKRGIQPLSDKEPREGKTVVIRAHGVTPETRRELKSAVICDATCPKVARVHSMVKKYHRKGFHIVIVGDEGHAEVEGILGYCNHEGTVVSGPEDLHRIMPGKPICIVAQTTQDRMVFNQTVEALKQIFEVCEVQNTICDATSERQGDVLALAKISDLIIVVGGINSANTQRLADLASRSCQTLMIQSPDSITWKMLQSSENIGIAAGASTPNWLIRETVDTVRSVIAENRGSVRRLAARFLATADMTGLMYYLPLLLLTVIFNRVSGNNAPVEHLLLVLWAALFFHFPGNSRKTGPGRIYHIPLFHSHSVIRVMFILTVSFVALMAAMRFDVSLTMLFGVLAFSGWLCRRESKNYIAGNMLEATGIASLIFLAPGMISRDFGDGSVILFLYFSLILFNRLLEYELKYYQINLIAGFRSIVVQVGVRQVYRVLSICYIAAASLSVLCALGLHSPELILLVIPPTLKMVYLRFRKENLDFLGVTSNYMLEAGVFLSFLAILLFLCI